MVKNISKDGKVIKDLRGYKVKREQFPQIYALIDQMSNERRNNGHIRTNQTGK